MLFLDQPWESFPVILNIDLKYQFSSITNLTKSLELNFSSQNESVYD